ncbi:MAG: homocysteine S-methyltransferase family protein [Lachnospiraceae bacterium]|nr:homocysteine S-methyltransferase family protein [Lachnospiraceae bacterium]MDY5700624.1 homocysteine S-methyltransferase family protein [Lachnospiraceae bacterium]
MTREEFRHLVKEKLVFLDGATGSNLQKRGMPNGVCPELWVTENPEVLLKLQKEYVEAGTNILYACTFGGNRIKLEEYGLAARQEEILTRLVSISKEAAGNKALVAGDITMTGEQLSPIGKLDFEELVDIYKEQIRYMEAAGADLLVVETMMSLQETRAALIAAKEVSDLPVMVTMTFEADGRALFGTDVLTAAIVLESLGADAFGINCSTGPEQMIPLFEQINSVVSIPLIAKPNAGLPMLDEEGTTVYSMGPQEFAKETKKLWEKGASILGGCCGTTPEHIKALTGLLSKEAPVSRQINRRRYVTSERQTLGFGLNDPFLVVGERINPTGKKKLQEELRAGKMEMVVEFAEAQEEKGASILDVNMGMSGVDEQELMLKALEEIAQVTNLPLSIDSSYINVCEAALRRYPGRALLNSISLEKEKVEKLLPVARKYGAMFVLLPLSDKGIPETLEEKIEIIDTLVEKALALGFTKEDIVVDGLVVTVGANKNGALEALETIRYCKENGLATTCGLSNISFGLPERTMINAGFLTMAIQAGLTMAIANPSQDLLMAAAFASDLLLNKEDSDIRYIEKMETISIGTAAPKEVSAKENTTVGDSPLYELVLKGKKNQIAEVTKELLAEGREASELLNNSLLPAINEVGDLFDQGKYFLPQLINSAEAMKASIAILQPFLVKEADTKDMPEIVFATVEGDIHDIGKNLVVLMLRNYGFIVHDLGKDVPKEEIVAKAMETNAAIIGLSALMTTTMQEMKQVIDYAHKMDCKAKIIIGGAVITEDYQKQIGADGYSKDAAESVKLVKKLLNIS